MKTKAEQAAYEASEAATGQNEEGRPVARAIRCDGCRHCRHAGSNRLKTFQRRFKSNDSTVEKLRPSDEESPGLLVPGRVDRSVIQPELMERYLSGMATSLTIDGRIQRFQVLVSESVPWCGKTATRSLSREAA
jgi:hypothetical protein